MSKKSKAKSKQKRKLLKQRRKQEEKARYEAFMKQGINSKSKRFQKNEKGNKIVRSGRHLNGPCGNVGCKRPECVRYQHSSWVRKLARQQAEANLA